MRKLLILFLLLFVIAGCTKKYTKPPEEAAAAPEGTVSEEVMEPEEEFIEPEEEFIEEDAIVEEEEPEEPALSPEEEAKLIFKDVLFDYDRYTIRPDARPALDAVASFLGNNLNLNVVIEGHCDERGTDEYNLALGEKRSRATKDYLVSLGVSPLRMIIITYGEEKPLCTEKDDVCWQQNRRAHFAIVRE
jgi:peptidoglycan-associated lipoprotein